MKESELFEIMSEISDRHIEGLYERRRRAAMKRRIMTFSRVAACLVLAVALMVAIRQVDISDPFGVPEDSTTAGSDVTHGDSSAGPGPGPGPDVTPDEKDFVIENGVLLSYTGNATEVVIPDEVHTIGGKAFTQCSGVNSITSVSIGSGVIKIADDAFEGMSSLGEIIVSEENEHFVFSNGVLVAVDGSVCFSFEPTGEMEINKIFDVLYDIAGNNNFAGHQIKCVLGDVTVLARCEDSYEEEYVSTVIIEEISAFGTSFKMTDSKYFGSHYANGRVELNGDVNRMTLADGALVYTKGRYYSGYTLIITADGIYESLTEYGAEEDPEWYNVMVYVYGVDGEGRVSYTRQPKKFALCPEFLTNIYEYCVSVKEFALETGYVTFRDGELIHCREKFYTADELSLKIGGAYSVITEENLAYHAGENALDGKKNALPSPFENIPSLGDVTLSDDNTKIIFSNGQLSVTPEELLIIYDVNAQAEINNITDVLYEISGTEHFIGRQIRFEYGDVKVTARSEDNGQEDDGRSIVVVEEVSAFDKILRPEDMAEKGMPSLGTIVIDEYCYRVNISLGSNALIYSKLDGSYGYTVIMTRYDMFDYITDGDPENPDPYLESIYTYSFDSTGALRYTRQPKKYALSTSGETDIYSYCVSLDEFALEEGCVTFDHMGLHRHYENSYTISEVLARYPEMYPNADKDKLENRAAQNRIFYKSASEEIRLNIGMGTVDPVVVFGLTYNELGLGLSNYPCLKKFIINDTVIDLERGEDGELYVTAIHAYGQKNELEHPRQMDGRDSNYVHVGKDFFGITFGGQWGDTYIFTENEVIELPAETADPDDDREFYNTSFYSYSADSYGRLTYERTAYKFIADEYTLRFCCGREELCREIGYATIVRGGLNYTVRNTLTVGETIDLDDLFRSERSWIYSITGMTSLEDLLEYNNGRYSQFS